jgi:simple sugar transport system ATP-binding protein
MDGAGSTRIDASASGPDHRSTPPLAELRGISKSFYRVAANDAVDLDLRSGEVHALLGENGAGKSTLCSILAGLYRQDSGEIVIDGESRSFHSPRDALALGVGMVYQHFRLVDPFTVAENLALGHPEARRRITASVLEAEAATLAERYEMPLHPRARIWELSVGEQQRVEILKLLHRGVRILILDEPTAVLTPQEGETLFRAVRAMRDDGKVIVFVSHKLREVLDVSDRVTVLRGGRRVGQLETKDADGRSLAAMMVGRNLVLSERTDEADPGQVVLKVDGVHVDGDRGDAAVRGVSLEVRSGETVGIAGVAGNGQRELTDAIAGLRTPASGRVTLNGRDVTRSSVSERITHGLSYIPEDRLHMGVAAGLPLEDNLVLKSYRSHRFSRGPALSSRAVRAWADELATRFDIRGARGLPVGLLSGGNLQRAIIARELSQRPDVLIAASPTRGLDVGATESVRRILLDQRGEGTGILLVSEDLDELEALCDRIIVMYEGTVVGEVTAGVFDAERVGLMMAGHGAG